jgi:Protein of unknown function C-terminus (DUF2399)
MADLTQPGDGRVPLPILGLPAGVRAVTVPRRGPAGPAVPVDRRRRVAARQIDLVSDLPAPPTRPPAQLTDADINWVLATASRRWPSVEHRFGTDAPQVAFGLVRAGAVTLRCDVREGHKLGRPRSWRLTDEWARQAAERHTARERETASWRDRAGAAGERIKDIDPGLAASLHRARGNELRLRILVHAADDLAHGVYHDGPRAFSQAHFANTKAHDDVAAVLLDAGASEGSVLALGLRRSPYLGLGGPVVLRINSGQELDLGLLDGPIRFRADQRAPVEAVTDATILLVIENLQAAETACDQFPGAAVAWTAGPPADPSLRLIVGLAKQAQQVLIVPDADLGGVRIAQRILAALDSPRRAQVVDVGTQPHTERAPFGTHSLAGLRAATTDVLIGEFAAACLTRGYPVEQEEASRAAISDALMPR